jgi:C4-dicarboxylate transporter, DctM subunit
MKRLLPERPALTSNVPIPTEVVKPSNQRKFTIAVGTTAVVTAALLVALLVLPASKLLVGMLVLLLMVALMMLRIPIGIAMAGAGIIGLYVLVGPRAAAGTLEQVMYTSFASWSLSVIPMFVLMGVALGKSGLMSNAYDSARKLLGWMPGGLAVATNFAGAGMAATSGSTIGIVYAVGRVSIPEMIRSGYSGSLATASTAMAGSLGQVIPPSILLVVYAGVAQTSVGPQLLAGFIPGIALALLFAVVIILWALIRPSSAPRGKSYSWSERAASLVHLVPVLVIASIVLGGIYFGVFTATEAGAYGALAVLIMGVAAVVLTARRKRIREGDTVSTARALGTFFSGTLMETVAAVASIFLLIAGVNVLTRVMAISGAAQWVADAVVGIGLGQIGFLLVLIVIYIFLGLFLDTLAMMLLTIPVFLIPLQTLGVDLVWFGVFLVILAEIGMVTPPMGVLGFVVHAVAVSSTKGMGVKITLGQVFVGVIPFIAACIGLLLAMIAWPEIALWLPSLSAAE